MSSFCSVLIGTSLKTIQDYIRQCLQIHWCGPSLGTWLGSSEAAYGLPAPPVPRKGISDVTNSSLWPLVCIESVRREVMGVQCIYFKWASISCRVRWVTWLFSPHTGVKVRSTSPDCGPGAIWWCSTSLLSSLSHIRQLEQWFTYLFVCFYDIVWLHECKGIAYLQICLIDHLLTDPLIAAALLDSSLMFQTF